MSLKKIDFATLNLQDALDLAILIEEEAHERYIEFSNLIGDRYEGDAETFFRTMAGYEIEHANQLRTRRESLYGKTPSRMNTEMFWDVEAPNAGEVRSYMSPYQAMQLALSSEVKAYNFFDEALKFVKDIEVKKLFEELRSEEKEHQELLKKRIAVTPANTEPDLSEDDIDEPGQH